MSDAKTKTGDPLDGTGWGEGDGFYHRLQFLTSLGQPKAHGGVYLSPPEIRAVLAVSRHLGGLREPVAALTGQNEVRWLEGQPGALGPVNTARRYSICVGPSEYWFLVPLGLYSDRSASERFPLEPLAERLTDLVDGDEDRRGAVVELAFHSDRGDAPRAARLRVGKADARAIRRAARAVRRSGAIHSVVSAADETPDSVWQHGAPAVELLGAGRAKWPGAAQSYAASELRVSADEFWVWASGEGWSEDGWHGATERRPVSELAGRFGLGPL